MSERGRLASASPLAAFAAAFLGGLAVALRLDVDGPRVSVYALACSAVLWLVWGTAAWIDAARRLRWPTWNPQWEYRLGFALVLAGLTEGAGAAEIYHDPTGLRDWFAVFCVVFLGATLLAMWTWLRRFGPSLPSPDAPLRDPSAS